MSEATYFGMTFHADVEGDWTDDQADGRNLVFDSLESAQAWWNQHYRGPDCHGNRAYPAFHHKEV